MAILVISLLIIGMGIGFFSGWFIHGRRHAMTSKTFAHSYYRGVTYLLRDDIDSSIDQFISSLDVNAETLEIHLGLGNLMRRKGEISKAIKVHENIMNCRELAPAQLHLSQLELARDFVHAGLLDRAENLLRELVDVESNCKSEALQQLIEIYQSEKEWNKALDAANCLSESKETVIPKNLDISKAHFCCEMAIIAIEKNDLDEAKLNLQQATRFDQYSVRATLLAAELEYKAGNYTQALDYLETIPRQDPELVNLSLELLRNIYEKMADHSGLISALKNLLEYYSSNDLVITLADELQKTSGDAPASAFVAEQLRKRPTIKVLNKLVELYLLNAEGKNKENLSLLKELVDKVIAEHPRYHCVKCGFSGEHLHWLCPSCKTWGSVRSVRGVAGE